MVEGPDEGITVAIFSGCDGGLGLDDGVDAADWWVWCGEWSARLKHRRRVVGWVDEELPL